MIDLIQALPLSSQLFLLTCAVIGAGIGAYFLIKQTIRQNQERKQQQQQEAAALHTAIVRVEDLVGRHLQVKLTYGAVPDIGLDKGEGVLCVLSGTTLVEPRAVRTWRGSYGGSSIRIAKGVSIHGGGTAGTSESHEEMRMVDNGTLTLTNHRLIFVGSKRTLSTPLKKIVDAETEGYNNWLRLNLQGRQKTACFQFRTDVPINYEYDGQSYSTRFHSGLLKIAIDQAMDPQTVH